MTDQTDKADKTKESRRPYEKGLWQEKKGFSLNDLMLGALVVIAALLSFTDFTFSLGSLRNLTALTLFLYIMTVFIYRNRYDRAKRRGREEAEYKGALHAYREKRGSIYDRHMASLVPAFCAAYRKRELREYRESLLIDIEMDYEEYRQKYLRMSTRQILKLSLSTEAKRILIQCNRAKSIRLTPGMILNENGEADRHELIGQSGRQRERQDKKKEALTRAVYVLFGALVAVDVIFHLSLVTVIQWVIRMLPVIVAVMTGDDGGYHNITVTETSFKISQTNVINLFEEWCERERIQS